MAKIHAVDEAYGRKEESQAQHKLFADAVQALQNRRVRSRLNHLYQPDAERDGEGIDLEETFQILFDFASR